MTVNTIELEFGDGQYLFALPLVQIAELQRKTDCGIGALYGRVMKGILQNPLTREITLAPSIAEFYALDVVETIRHGLIGGGRGIVSGEEVKVTPLIANRLIETYVMSQPLMDAWEKAAAVLGACILGYDPPKKDPPAVERAPRKRKNAKAG